MVKIGNTKMTWNRPNDTCSGVTPLLDHDVSINFLSLPIAVLGIVVSFLEPNDGPLSLHQTCRHFKASCNWKLMVQHCNCAWNNDTNLPDAMSWNHHLVVRWTKILCRMHRDVAVDLFWKNPAISPMILRELLLKAINLGEVKRVKEVLKDHRCILKGALRKAFVEKRHEMVPMLKEDPRARKYWKCCCENAATASPSNDDLVVVPCLHRPCVNEIPGFWGSFDADIVCQDCLDQFRCAICEDYECMQCRQRLTETPFAEVQRKKFVRCTVCERTVCGCCYSQCLSCSNVICKDCVTLDNRSLNETPEEISCTTCQANAENITAMGQHNNRKQRIRGKSLLQW